MRVLQYLIPEEFNNYKISSFLTKQGYSQQNLKSLRQSQDSIMLNGRSVYMNEFLRGGERLEVILPLEEASEHIESVEIPLDIVFEDEDLLVINKPANMPIHPSINNYDNTLANGVAYYMKSQGDNNFVYRCINRLDRDTSGLTIIAKNMVSASGLYQQMKSRQITRYYYAIVEGIMDADGGTIDKPISRVSDSIITRCVDFEHGQAAITHWEMLASGRDGDLSLVRCHLETGRTHQIRVHMTSIGHPLVGDCLYNPDNHMMPRQALHAGEILFTHPITGDQMNFKADYPEDMAAIIEKYL